MQGDTARVRAEQVSDLALEFPRVNPAVIGRPYRYGYAILTTLTPSFEGAVKLDHHTGQTEYQHFTGGKASEFTFVPRAGAEGEDDGWLIGFVYQPELNRSRLVILQGQAFSGEPAASIWIPDQHVPLGAHGDWFPAWVTL